MMTNNNTNCVVLHVDEDIDWLNKSQTLEEIIDEFKNKFNIDQHKQIEICGENNKDLIDFLTNIKLYCLNTTEVHSIFKMVHHWHTPQQFLGNILHVLCYWTHGQEIANGIYVDIQDIMKIDKVNLCRLNKTIHDINNLSQNIINNEKLQKIQTQELRNSYGSLDNRILKIITDTSTTSKSFETKISENRMILGLLSCESDNTIQAMTRLENIQHKQQKILENAILCVSNSNSKEIKNINKDIDEIAECMITLTDASLDEREINKQQSEYFNNTIHILETKLVNQNNKIDELETQLRDIIFTIEYKKEEDPYNTIKLIIINSLMACIYIGGLYILTIDTLENI
jgi:hypothetical protein